MMKRGREDESSTEADAAECLVRLSCASRNSAGSSGRVMFECKTCGRAFSSFQALGGHSASHHKKPKPSPGEAATAMASEAVRVKAEPTVHECSICGMKFGLGQALGGHMRRHRIELKGGGVVGDRPRGIVSDQDAKLLVPVLRRSLSKNKRVMCMDLNLTPLENDLELLFGKMAPKVDRRLV
uniref:C2H2-type domain-containing protein n=1 Tax=Kalanchoe fedtschenkoi TaxID=63787 RepID=A0A7N0TA15_KALFE